MSDEDLAKLGKDIKANELRNPIIFWTRTALYSTGEIALRRWSALELT
jgi:hypothetical protein